MLEDAWESALSDAGFLTHISSDPAHPPPLSFGIGR